MADNQSSEATENSGTEEQTVEQQLDAGTLNLFSEEESKPEVKGTEKQPGEGDEKVASKFEELSRREAELLEQKQKLDSDSAELDRMRRLKDAAGKDPDELLKEFGIDPLEYAFKKYVETPEGEKEEKEPDVKTVQKQLEELKQQNQQERFQLLYQREVDHLSGVMEKTKEEFPVLYSEFSNQKSEISNAIIQEVAIRAKKDGKKPDYSDVLKEAEGLVRNNAISAIKRMAGIAPLREEIAKLLGIAPEPKAQPSNQQRTLNESLSTDSSAGKKVDLTMEEAEEEFIKAMKESGFSDE